MCVVGRGGKRKGEEKREGEGIGRREEIEAEGGDGRVGGGGRGTRGRRG